ncbi:MAG: hypothetical protein JW881_16430 [Spirochaetales bacterium]|nr:hypothetical protein [Spirochaetales bacterium]
MKIRKKSCKICRKNLNENWLGFHAENFETIKCFFSAYGRLDGDWIAVSKKVVQCRSCGGIYLATFFEEKDITGDFDSFNLDSITKDQLEELLKNPPKAEDIPGFIENKK